MKKYKSYTVDPKGCENLAKALIEHAATLGYIELKHGLKFNETHLFYAGWWENVNKYGYCEKQSPTHTYSEMLSPRQFFRLTKEDVVIEPETEIYVFGKMDSHKEGYSLTKDEADDVVHFMKKIVKEREA